MAIGVFRRDFFASPEPPAVSGSASPSLVILRVFIAFSVESFCLDRSCLACFLVRIASGPQKYLRCHTIDRGSSLRLQYSHSTLYDSTILR